MNSKNEEVVYNIGTTFLSSAFPTDLGALLDAQKQAIFFRLWILKYRIFKVTSWQPKLSCRVE